MFRRFTWAVSLLLAVAACTTSTGDAASTSETPPTSAVVIGPGRLVVVDGGGDVVIIDPDGSGRKAITDDAGDTAVYSQPIWSPDGLSLAWGQATPDGFAVGMQRFQDEAPTSVETPNLPFYLYWSPDSENIGVLHNGSDGLDFRIVDVPSTTASVVAGGSPFYFSWSPRGQRVVIHVGPDRFETVEPDGTREELGSTAAGYLAPFWTPAGIFHVDDGELVVEDTDGERRPIVEVGDFTSFVVNPQGTRVALQSTGGSPGISVGLVEVAAVPDEVVVVVDVATGESEVLTELPALGFFWSPDGESLLLMTLTEQGIAPTVWTANGTKTDYAEFLPSVVMVRDMMPFFPQYAQSMSYWSPDSTAFVYAADDGIWVQELDGARPNNVSDGSWVAWSS